MIKYHKVWFSSGNFLLGALVIACAWEKLDWWWFWATLVLETCAGFSWMELAKESPDAE